MANVPLPRQFLFLPAERMDARIGRLYRFHPRCGRDRLYLRRWHRRDSRAGGKEYEQDDRGRAKHGAAGLERGWWREEGDVVNDKPLASRLQENGTATMDIM